MIRLPITNNMKQNKKLKKFETKAASLLNTIVLLLIYKVSKVTKYYTNSMNYMYVTSEL